jgi:rare lipoprotein A
LGLNDRPQTKTSEVIGIKARMLIVSALALMLLAPGAFAGSRVVKGRAVYYADSLKGNGMACGGTYHPSKMVAAHRSLPCGTKLRVKNRANGKVVTVRVKDRGPYGEKSTILDLSRRAARILGYVDNGSAKVRATIKS